MQDMIKRIIEVDRQAQADLAKVNQLKVDSEQKISEMKDKKRDEYIEKARANIKVMEKEEKVKAAVRLKVIENSYKKTSNKIDKIYEKNKDVWVDAIVKRVIEG